MNTCNRKFYSSFLQKSLDYKIIKCNQQIEDAYLLYVQDGKDYLELGGLEKAILDIVLANPELASHLIFVLIHPGDSAERWNSFTRTGSSFYNYVHFMNIEFIPEIESNLGIESISKRGLLGDSLAGNISLNIALEKPGLWTHLLLQSPAISDGDIRQLENVKLTGWNVYQTVGVYENEFISSVSKEKIYFLKRNRELYQSFLLSHVNVDYRESEDEHLWEVWARDLPAALQFFVKGVQT
ncbi:esterase family protein [Bacillus sp. D386]|uniref:alpha/beta hydrolase n=1 Tax=Bacillus sp. D386 TaxID=2587155 RepID=UPI0015D5F648|nr:alpha/beta hydrolase-fold protein [Bacillus sp. D386]